MSNSAVNLLATFLTGALRMPVLMANAGNVLIVGELGRRGINSLLAGIRVTIKDANDEKSYANRMEHLAPPLYKIFTVFSDRNKYPTLILTAWFVASVVFCNLSWIASVALLGKPSPIYNQVLDYVGPFYIKLDYVHPFVQHFFK